MSSSVITTAHDHHACIADALHKAEAVCGERGVRLTPIRKRVLELVWEDHRPSGAYDLLDRLRDEGWGSAPPLIYRALAFLVEQGLIHKLSTLNAYVGCPRGGEDHGAQFLICRDCGVVAEMHDRSVTSALRAAATGAGFAVEAPVIEVEGVCAACSSPSGPRPT